MVKKFLLSLVISLAAISVVSTLNSQPAFAECRDFLGLKSWDCNVDLNAIDNQDALKSGIWTIVANVLVDITVVAAYLVVGYTIYGGYQYTMSGGDPNKVASGKKTLVHAFLGLAIVMLANVILNSISIALGADFSENCIQANSCASSNPVAMVTSAIQWVIGVVGFVAAIYVVYGGITYMTSAGDPNKLAKAKQIITYALIGLLIVALSEIIVSFVSGMIGAAG